MKKRLTFGAVFVAFILATLLPGTLVYARPPARDCNDGSVWINYPQAGSVVSGQFSISGTASLPGNDFQYYKVEYSSVGQNAWVVIVNGVRTPVVNGPLATANADSLAPGDYTVRVLAVDRTGNYCEADVSPIHVGASPTDTPTPEDTPTPADTPTPNATPVGTPTAQTQDLAGKVEQAVSRTPTLTIQIPTVQPGTNSLISPGNGSSSSIPTLPLAQLNSFGSSAMGWAGSLGQSFVFGIQLTAGIFILLGAIVFLRRNL